MFGLLRALSLAPSAALFGAVAFAWSGTLVANGHWYMRMEPLALLPGLLWALGALDRAEGARRGLPAAMFALQLALTWSASFPPFAIPCTLFCGLFTLALAVLILFALWYRKTRRETAAVREAGDPAAD
jgi:hypothetical protein